MSFTPSVPEGKSVITVNPHKIPLPKDFRITKIHFSCLPPGAWAGGHRHQRREIFFSYSDITFIWLDDLGHKHTEMMGVNSDGTLRIYVVGSGTPHFLVNKGRFDMVYVELADGKLEGVINLDFGQKDEVV